MQDTPSHDRFAQHLSLAAATTLDVTRELKARFRTKRFEEIQELVNSWKARCERGHGARRALWPVLQRAERALSAARAGEPFTF